MVVVVVVVEARVAVVVVVVVVVAAITASIPPIVAVAAMTVAIAILDFVDLWRCSLLLVFLVTLAVNMLVTLRSRRAKWSFRDPFLMNMNLPS